MRRLASLRRIVAGVEGLEQSSVFNGVSGYRLLKACCAYACAPWRLANRLTAIWDTHRASGGDNLLAPFMGSPVPEGQSP
jgi:hypothetical protein